MKKPKQIRSVVVDLDNTLINRYGDISGNNSSILRQLNSEGVIVGLASGRSADEVARNLDFWKLTQAVSFIIGSNGCDYLNLQNKKIRRTDYLDFEDVKKFASGFHDDQAVWAVLSRGRLYVSRMTFRVALYCITHRLKPFTGPLEDLKGQTFSRILIIAPSREIKKIFSSWKLKDFKAMPAGKHVIEVVHPEISKFEGLKKALDDFDILPEEVMTFGDDYNDIELIRRTEGIAMKNAVDPLVEVSRGKTKYCAAQDGVAYHLNALLLGDDYVFGIPEPEEEDEHSELLEKKDPAPEDASNTAKPAGLPD